MNSGNPLYSQFAEFLARRQTSFDPALDIREHILAIREKSTAFGFVAKNLTEKYARNLPMLFPDWRSVENPSARNSAHFFASGTIYRDRETSHQGYMKLLNLMPPEADPILMEQGFLASAYSWSHAFRDGDPKAACLGYVYDDIAHYFMADYPNRLIHKLNSDEDLSEAELLRARRLIERIVAQKISKYNAQPMHAPTMTQGYTHRVLVADQAFADASTIYGKVGEREFEQMLVAALRENPDAEILVKTHPDTSWEKGKRTGYYSHLTSTGRVRLLREPVNPYSLFELVDKVYVGTSQIGLEALFAGREVVCFGAPFYAGWGLTDDRQTIPHRYRQRSLEELFHYFYIWYTIYHVPGLPVPSEIEQVLDYIETNRPVQLPISGSENERAPKVSVIIPVYGVEKYIEQCIASVQSQSLSDLEIITVNDCSPDRSQEIIDQMASADPRIRPIVLAENVGQGFARNRGIEAARGEYIWFIDSDDWMVDPDALEQLVAAASENSLDMVRGRKAYEAVYVANDALLFERPDKSERHFPADIPKTTYEDSPELLHNRHFWVWLYRREFLNEHGIRFRTPQWEERAFLVNALANSKSIGLCAVDAIAYRVRTTSTARRQRTARDTERMLTNFDATFDALLAKGAGDRGHPLRRHLNFQVSQFVDFMVLGEPYRLVERESTHARDEYLKHVAEVFDRCDFRPCDFVTNLDTLRLRYLDAGAYQLAVAAIRLSRPDILKYAVNLSPVPQAKLYDFLLQDFPEGPDLDLQDALNRYARNHLVGTARAILPKPTKKPRIIIHLGASKTGSTYLQHLMEGNRPALLQNGVWYPEVGLFWQPNREHKQAGHAEFTFSATNGLRALKNHIKVGLGLLKGNIHTIVLSSEAFFLNPRSINLVRYFRDYPVEMVVYLRRQDEWANAQYCEFVAGGAVGRVDQPIGEWLQLPDTKLRLDYLSMLDRWSDAIGQENVHVRVFQKDKLQDRDLVSDFAEATGLDILNRLPRPQDDNAARLSGAHVELIRQFNSRPFRDRRAYFAFVEDVTQGALAWRESQGLTMPKPWVLPADEAARLMNEYDETNGEIARRYLGWDDGVLFGPAGPVPEAGSVHAAEITLAAKCYERARLQESELQEVPLVTAPLRIVNYGLFGWRLWLLAPLVAILYARRASPKLLAEYRNEPAEFIREHWAARRPLMTGVLFPNGNPLGPFGILRVWVKLGRPVLRALGRPELLESFEADPVLFARSINSRALRLVGRLLFPFGELRGEPDPQVAGDR